MHPAPVGACAQLISPAAPHLRGRWWRQGDKLQVALQNLGDWTIEIVKRSDVAKGFVLAAQALGGRASLAWRTNP